MLAAQLYNVLENIEIVTHAVYMRLGVPGGDGRRELARDPPRLRFYAAHGLRDAPRPAP